MENNFEISDQQLCFFNLFFNLLFFLQILLLISNVFWKVGPCNLRISRKSMKCPFGMKCKYVPQCVLILYVRLYHINQQIKCISLLYKHLSLFVGPHRKLESKFWKKNFENNFLKKWTKNAKKVPHENFQCACKVCKYLLWDYHLVMSPKCP